MTRNWFCATKIPPSLSQARNAVHVTKQKEGHQKPCALNRDHTSCTGTHVDLLLLLLLSTILHLTPQNEELNRLKCSTLTTGCRRYGYLFLTVAAGWAVFYHHYAIICAIIIPLLCHHFCHLSDNSLLVRFGHFWKSSFRQQQWPKLPHQPRQLTLSKSTPRVIRQ